MAERNLSIIQVIRDAGRIKEVILADKELLGQIARVADELICAFQNGNKVLLCGNGGSAADAQHIAAELSGQFYFDRKPLFAEALHVNTSYLTAVANDYGYDEVFLRLVKAKGAPGDILIGLSTSGNSPNVIKALKAAREQQMVTIGFTGENGRRMNGLCRYLLKAPSDDTARIQECHMLFGHIISELVERELFGTKKPVLFLDRDGVINRRIEDGYVTDWSEFVFLPGALDALRLAKQSGYLVVVVTNQRCVARGILSVEKLGQIHQRMKEEVTLSGGDVDLVYYCPHDVEEGCSCRKPKPGLLLTAIHALNRRGVEIDWDGSYVIGDSQSDIDAGKAAGLKTMGIGDSAGECELIAPDLVKAVETIIGSNTRSSKCS